MGNNKRLKFSPAVLKALGLIPTDVVFNPDLHRLSSFTIFSDYPLTDEEKRETVIYCGHNQVSNDTTLVLKCGTELLLTTANGESRLIRVRKTGYVLGVDPSTCEKSCRGRFFIPLRDPDLDGGVLAIPEKSDSSGGVKELFKHMSAAEVTANLMTAEINFFNQCSKWLNYSKIDKTILGFDGFEKVVLNFIPENDHHTRYALLTSPELALSLKGFGVEVFESHMYTLKDTVIIIATKNGYSWVGIMWFQVRLEEAVIKEALMINI